jgi:hypothetical protein
MNNEVITQEKPMSVLDVKTQVNTIQHIMGAVMKRGTHYDTLPGCGNKPTLLKPGAEKIMMTFRLSCDPEVEDLSNDDEIRFRVKTKLTARDGSFVGSGIGECSTNEEKYKWRRAVCDEEFEETLENMRRKKWAFYQGKTSQTLQIRTNPADLANTVLKMAKKRSLVDAVLTATAASDCFVQDIEDLPEEIVEGMMQDETPASSKPAVAMPQKKETAQEPKAEGPAFICSQCQAEITEKVHKYSTEKMGAALCFGCQKKGTGHSA